MPKDPVVYSVWVAIVKFQTLKLINENIATVSIGNEKVISFTRSLGRRIELPQQFLSFFIHHSVMRRFFRCLTLLIPVINITIACSNNQVESVDPLGTEGKVKWIISHSIAFKHLSLQWLLSFKLFPIESNEVELAATNLNLSPISDQGR